MKPTFARIRFVLPRDRRLNAEERTVTIARTELPIAFELVGLDGATITQSANLVVRSSPLPTSEAAAEIGARAQLAVLIAATEIRLGVDLGKDGPKSRFMPAGLEMVRQANDIPSETAVENDSMGLLLVDASQKTVFAGMGNVQAIVGSPVDRFAAAFTKGYGIAPSVTERSLLALELFSASRFEASLRARFLTLVSAIECIVDRSPRGDDALALIASFTDQLKRAALDELDYSQLVGGIRDLRRRSITGSCKDLVEQCVGAEEAALFGKCYRARSELVHTGHTEFDLGTNTTKLEAIVAETIIKSIARVA